MRTRIGIKECFLVRRVLSVRHATEARCLWFEDASAALLEGRPSSAAPRWIELETEGSGEQGHGPVPVQ